MQDEKKPDAKPEKRKPPQAFIDNRHPNFTSENQPANPGRPKGSQSLKDLLRWALEETIDIKDKKGKIIRKTTVKEAIMMALCNKAMNGKVDAVKEVFDRIEGKAPQNLHLTGNVEVPVIKVELEKTNE